VLHLAFGVDADRLQSILEEHEVTINLHNEPYESFENRVCIHLAAGHLVISERLNPRHGLEPGIDFLEIETPEELLHLMLPLHRWPGTYDRVRIRGRQKAEQFRAMHSRGRILVLPNAWDAASAKIFEAAGFDAVATTSAGVSYTAGYPDGELIPRADMLTIVRWIVGCVSIPVTADIESGFASDANGIRETRRDGLFAVDVLARRDGLFHGSSLG